MAGLRSLELDFYPFAQDLVDAAAEARLSPRVTSARRSNAEQTRLYRRCETGTCKYPVAPPGHSAHELGLAFDLVVTPMSALPDVGAFWQGMGGAWYPSDPIHFEAPGASQLARSGVETPQETPDSFLKKVIEAGLSAGFPLEVLTYRLATNPKRLLSDLETFLPFKLSLALTMWDLFS